MRGERHRRRRPQHRGRVVPHLVEQLVDRPPAVVQRGDQPPLALEPVGDVLVELGRRVVDQRAVAGAEDSEPGAAQPREPVE